MTYLPNNSYPLGLSGNDFQDPTPVKITGVGVVGKEFSVLSGTVGRYKTPTKPVLLKVVPKDIEDSVGGKGAHELTVVGLDENWELIHQQVRLKGQTPVALKIKMIRLLSAHVRLSGTYASQDQGSHFGTISLSDFNHDEIWAEILAEDLYFGQTTIGAYTVPKGKTARIIRSDLTSSSEIDFVITQRPYADDYTKPLKGIRSVVKYWPSVNNISPSASSFSCNSFVGPCDILCMAKSKSDKSAIVSVNVELMLTDKERR